MDNKLTGNFGHDIAKTRLASRLEANGLTIETLIEKIKKHPVIAELRASGACKIAKIGMEYRIFFTNDEWKHRPAWLVGGRIVGTICSNYISDGYGCSGLVNTSLKRGQHQYIKYQIIGLDKLSHKWTKAHYSTEFNINLSNNKASKKYNGYGGI